jgi:hypothetical protein
MQLLCLALFLAHYSTTNPDLCQQYVDGFHYDSAKAMYSAYVSELYLFDQAYRLFNENVATVLSKGSLQDFLVRRVFF